MKQTIAELEVALRNMKAACEQAVDGMVALGREFEAYIRSAEDLMTVDERYRYYALRGEGHAPLDAIHILKFKKP